MSLYAYGLPVTTNEFRDRTANHSTYAGVMSPSFRCAKCGENKRVSGRKRCGNGWACADCQKAPSMFSALLLGMEIKLPKGKARTVTFKTEADKEMLCGEPEQLANLQKIRDAIASGICTRPGLQESTGLSFMTLSRRVAELIDAEEVVKVRIGNQYEWRFK